MFCWIPHFNSHSHQSLQTLALMMIVIFSRGQFAVVRKCMEQKSGAEYAAKIMRKRRVARGVAAADIGE